MMLPSLPTRLIAMLLTGCLLCSSVLGQPSAPEALSAAQRDAALKAIMSAFQEQYVFP
jgi:hypothetical protein